MTDHINPFRNQIDLAGRCIGSGHKPFLIAEISANHNNSLERAKALVKAAADSKADAVKFQTYTPDSITLDSDKPDFQIHGGLWDGRTLYSLYEQGSLPYEWHEPLFDYARSLGLVVISSPFDEQAVDFLMEIGVDALKIASFECNHIPLISYAAAQGVPLIMSTGMANLAEISEAVDTVRPLNDQLILLHCISSYPAPPEDYNLSNIKLLRDEFGCQIGLSDHCTTNEIATASIALGSVLIEKHFTLNRDGGGLDDSFSLEPNDFINLRTCVDNVFQSIANSSGVVSCEEPSKKFRRSIYSARAIHRGETFSEENIKVVRPGFGLHPRYMPRLIGNKATRDIAFAEPIQESDFE